MRLHGRAGETRALAQLVEAAAGGSSCVLVVRGEAGIGKTTLLDRAADTAGRAGMEVLAVAGVEAERELGYAALHRLLARVAEDRTALPAPQRDALGVAWGLVEGRPADPFRVALAVLTLLTRRAARRPVLCVCDDAQWVDRESLRVLAFVARRIDADPVVVLFGLRDPGEGADDVTDHTDHTVLADLPALQVDGLPVEAVRTLAAEAAHGRFDERELDRLLVETGGNPLAVRELVAGWARDGGRPGASAWSASVAARPSLPARLEDRFGEQVRALPGAVRTLLLVVAAEPTGDADLVWRTLGHLGATGGAAGLADAARPAVAAGLLVLAPVVGFRHPLQRSAVHRGADPAQRRRVHAALAASIPAGTDTDRRTWHRAEATTGPDEQIAAELEESAARARDRAGYSTEAAFLAAAAERTAEPAACGRRLFAAAVAAIRAGLPGTAHRLLETVPRAAGEELLLVTALARGAALVQLDRCAEGAPLMADAAHGLAAVLPPPQAREALLEVVQNVLLTPHVELGPVRRMLDGAAGAVAAPPAEPAFADVALDGYRRHLLDGGPDGTAGLRRVVHALRGGLTHEVAIRWAPVCVAAPRELFDDAAMDDVTERLLTLARANATATGLRVALVGRAITATLLGSLDEAELLHAEAAQVAALGGSPFLQRAHDALLRAWRGTRRASSTRPPRCPRHRRVPWPARRCSSSAPPVRCSRSGWAGTTTGCARALSCSTRTRRSGATSCCPTSSRPGSGAAAGTPPRPRRRGSRCAPRRPGRPGRAACTAATARCSRGAPRRSRCTARRSSTWTAPSCAPSGPGHGCCTASGCGAGAAAPRPAPSWRGPTAASSPWAPRRSPSGPAPSWRRRAPRCAGRPARRAP